MRVTHQRMQEHLLEGHLACGLQTGRKAKQKKRKMSVRTAIACQALAWQQPGGDWAIKKGNARPGQRQAAAVPPAVPPPTRQLHAHHHHACHPEEQDVVARLQQPRGVKLLQILRLLRPLEHCRRHKAE
jgi:hypothetical protein